MTKDHRQTIRKTFPISDLELQLHLQQPPLLPTPLHHFIIRTCIDLEVVNFFQLVASSARALSALCIQNHDFGLRIFGIDSSVFARRLLHVKSPRPIPCSHARGYAS